GDLDGAITAARRAGALDAASAAYADASAILALVLSLQGSGPAARGLAEEVAASAVARQGRGRLTRQAPALVDTICESQRGRLPALDALALPTDAQPAVLRHALT